MQTGNTQRKIIRARSVAPRARGPHVDTDRARFETRDFTSQKLALVYFLGIDFLNLPDPKRGVEHTPRRPGRPISRLALDSVFCGLEPRRGIAYDSGPVIP